MVDSTPWLFLMSQRDEVREWHREHLRGGLRGPPASNAGMVENLRLSGSLRSPECVAAFQAVDRQNFWPADSGELAYADMPLRHGRLHLSAPHIYAKALESLMPLLPGMSFLNVGSGTGYFNSIVSELVGPLATNHGIDIWSETIAHSTRCCQAIGKRSIEFTLGNAYQLDVGQTTRYDRIYLGACASSRSKYLYRLLEVGGVLIGPFQAGHTQQLRRVVRQTETEFNVDVLGSVQFASLVEPPPEAVEAAVAAPPPVLPTRSYGGIATPPGTAEDGAQATGLPGVPFTFSLWERPWTPERCWLYPASFKRTVAMGLMCRPRDQALPCLPTEIWVKHILPWCPKWWFDAVACGRHRRCTVGCPPDGGNIVSEAAGAVQAIAAAPQKPPSNDAGDDAEQSDDGVSTRAPMSSAPSAESTPESRPADPPPDIEAGAVSLAAEDQSHDEGPVELGDVLVEVFGNGQRHAIGAGNDPDDDMEPDEVGPRLAVPLRVLQLLAADARRRRERRRARQEEDTDDAGDGAGDGIVSDDDDDAPASPSGGTGGGRASGDDDMHDAADESEAETDMDDADMSDMVATL